MVLGKLDWYDELAFYDRNLILYIAISYYMVIYNRSTYFDRVYVAPDLVVFWRVLKK